MKKWVFLIFVFLFSFELHSQMAQRAVEKEIEAGNILGAVIMSGTPGEVFFLEAYGERDVGKPMKKNCIFDVSSVTKPSTVGTSLAMLLDQGRIELDNKMNEHLPGLKGQGSCKITIRHAATHTSGIDNTKRLSREYKGEDLVKAILTYDNKWDAGTKYHYSCLGFIRLSEMIASITSREFDEYVSNEIFRPLEMKDTQFGPLENKRKLKRMVKTNARLGQIQDPNTKNIGRPLGNAGMFTTASDLSHLAVMWLQKGQYKDKRFFSEEVHEKMVRKQTQLANRGITWTLLDKSFGPSNLSASTYYHTGYNGHALWIDPEKNMYFIVLTVWKHPDIHASVEEGRQARVRISEAVIEDALNMSKKNINQ